MSSTQDAYAANDDVLDEAFPALSANQLEDIINRGKTIAPRVSEGEKTPTQPTQEPVSLPTVPKATRAEVKKKRKMLSRNFDVQGTSEPTTTAVVPPLEGEERQEAEAAGAGERTKEPDESSAGLHVEEEHADEEWGEDFETSNHDLPIEDDTDEGMYGRHQPELSSTSSYLAELRENMAEQNNRIMRAIEEVKKDNNTAYTTLADKIRELERRFQPDPSSHTSAKAAATLDPRSSDPSSSIQPTAASSFKLSFAERLRQKRMEGGGQ